MECQHCHNDTTENHTLCTACEMTFFHTLIRLANDIMPLHDSLDATLHPGGHSPVRIQTTTPPTPIRLDVLDLIDILDSTAYELRRRLDGIDAHLDAPDPQCEDLRMTLITCAGHPRLAMFPDAGMYLDVLADLAVRIDHVLDPPEEHREIGTCECCATMLTAGSRDQWVTCPVCGREQRVQTVKLKRLERLCFDDSRRGSAAGIARAFTDAGITLRAATIRKWVQRGRLTRSPQGIAYCDAYRLVIAGVSQLD